MTLVVALALVAVVAFLVHGLTGTYLLARLSELGATDRERWVVPLHSFAAAALGVSAAWLGMVLL